MKNYRIIVLGNELAGDDAAAIEAIRNFDDNDHIVIAGRPGLDLIDYLDTDEFVILVDVTRTGVPPGLIVKLSMKKLQEAALADVSFSNYGFGPAETLKLMKSLNKPLPEGCFIGIEGSQFKVGAGTSSMVRSAMPKLIQEIENTIRSIGFSRTGRMQHSA